EEALARAETPTVFTGREYKDGTEVRPHNLSFWGHLEVEPRAAGDLHAICINATVFPRSLFELVRFDDALWYGSEEADIAAQAEAVGYRIAFLPELVVDHHPSATNRAEYSAEVEVSRLYATYKRYRWIERNRLKAAAYAFLAPAHHVAST